MTSTLVVGLDGESSGERAVAFASNLARQLENAEILIVYVIEWSPFSFQTAEENAQRHKRREEEIQQATERVLTPAVDGLTSQGIKARGIVQHGDVSTTLNRLAVENKADQIIVSRSSEGGFAKKIFGSSTANLVMSASVPVTVVS
jgi:nucleotide-binding universal stress UspA family protein